MSEGSGFRVRGSGNEESQRNFSTPERRTPNPEPLSSHEFAKLLAPFAPFSPAPVALAVSGGPDSMALAFGARRCREMGTLIALIVDHGLRDGTAAEAARTKEVLESLQIPAEVLRWEHPPITKRLQEAARAARYRLLIEACQRHGADALLLAHQREDQAETILMRFAKGSGIEGLGGMRAETRMDGVRLLRPLLGIPKARLIATCEAAGISYVRDPSNTAEKFARGRLRRVMPLLEAEGFTADRLIDLGARAAEAADALAHYTEALLRVAATRDAAGTMHIQLEQLRSAPQAVALRALASCLQEISREDYPPERAALLSLLHALCADADMQARTLHGCLIGKTPTHAHLWREFAAIADAQKIAPGETVLWDGRWRVTVAPGAGHVFDIRALGNPPHELLDRLAPGLRQTIPQGRARAALPALWVNGELALIPELPSQMSEARCWISLTKSIFDTDP